METRMETTGATQTAEDKVRDVVSKAAKLLRGRSVGGGALSPADIAALKRSEASRPESAYYKLEALVMGGDLPPHDQTERWVAIIIGLAHVASLEPPRLSLGAALAVANYGAVRLSHLLGASAHDLLDALPRLGKFLAAKRLGVNWDDAALLMMSADDMPRGSKDAVRLRVQRDHDRAVR